MAFSCPPAVEIGSEDQVGGGGCPLFSPGVGLGLDVLVEVRWDPDGDAFGGGIWVGDFPVGCGVGLQPFGEKLAEHFRLWDTGTVGGALDPLGQGRGEAEGAVRRRRGEVPLLLQCFFEHAPGGCCGGDIPPVGCGLDAAG